ncbi:cytochrome c oxidase assembly factor 1 homolog [Centropristis striata]|uniref:cytochrome c oxidase assembly factor 1 homolog n=1 Tax=Centropristis striata TaxID=184440 RepID=UPI0027E0687E|nr:cytochrome c oxidase assembly factor 1 homolog [Centropristis striata]
MYPQCVTFTEVNAAAETSYSCPAAVAQGKEAKMSYSEKLRYHNKLLRIQISFSVLNVAILGIAYYWGKRNRVKEDYHRLPMQKLEGCPLAMQRLGAPPLKVHSFSVIDRNVQEDVTGIKIKIPVTGSQTKGDLYAFSIGHPHCDRWSLKQAVLQLREGEIIDLLDPPPPEEPELQTETWH